MNVLVTAESRLGLGMASALARPRATVAADVQDERIVAVDFERWLRDRTSRG